MTTTPALLNDDGSASIATALLMSHHAFRRDLARFASAVGRVVAGEGARAPDLAAEWAQYRGALHGHHEVEDGQMFPGMRGAHPELAPVFDELSAQHARIDPLLARGDAAFAELPAGAAAAAAVIAELSALIDQHLALEEAHVPPFLRAASAFPPPATDAEAEMYAQGFAWSSEGVAPEVLERVYAMLPANVTTRLPAARAAFAERCARVWGPVAAGASRTSVPDWLARG
ncbi:MAG TPA: hemerythrin domain-containing protein [Polyangia bacterium]|nr:hemerythrin domain-containing protein [Polyangia bacterium]